jgi:hypothetical protein
MLFAGCQKDFLNTRIDTSYTNATIVTDRSTLFSFAASCYGSLQYGYAAIDNNLFAGVSDEAQITSASSNTLVFNQGIINANNNPDGGIYKTYYDGIRAVNFFLQYSINGNQFLALNRDTITDPVGFATDKQNLAWYIAEAHICRAYYYAELIKRFGGVPIVPETYQGTSPDSLLIPASAYDSVVAYIVREIENNKAGLQVNWATSAYTGNAGRFSLGSALALEARVLLFAASPLHNPTNDVTRWQKAAAAANNVITTSGLNYALYTGGYQNYFMGATSIASTETIFAIRRTANNTIETQNYPISTPGGNSGVCPTDNLVSSYEYIGAVNPANPYANRDPRLAASIVTNGSTWNSRTIDESPGGTDDMANRNASRTGYYLKKFLTDNLNLVNGGTASNQWVAYRYGEVLLEYAEAMNEAYGPDNANGYKYTARQALTLVRNRASTSLPAVTVTVAPDIASFRTVLKHERRVELAFEDYRYWDLLRWQDAATVLNQPVTGVAVTKVSAGVWSYAPITVATRTFTAPTNYYYPFSHADIVNSQGTLVQNPGY